MQKDKDDAAKEDAEELTLQIQKSLMIRKMYTKMVRIPVLHRDLEVRSPYRSHLKNDEITDIQVTSAPGEDSAYLSRREGVISSIISAQSTDVDTVSGATFSSTGIINAVVDALGRRRTDEKRGRERSV